MVPQCPDNKAGRVRHGRNYYDSLRIVIVVKLFDDLLGEHCSGWLSSTTYPDVREARE